MSFEEQKNLEDKFLMHTYGRKPVEFVQGEGMTLTDSEGKTYMDFLSGIGTCSLGHCHPVVADAVAEQAHKLIHVSNYYYIENRGEVAQKLSDMLNETIPTFFRAPWKTFFANSGAEANECAIKLARKWSRKEGCGGYKIIVLEGGFHGRTLATLAATAQPAKQAPFAPLPEGFIAIPANDIDTLKKTFLAHPGEIAAVMMEPIQGEGGVHPIDGDYMFEALKVARRNGALLIADEVQTGIYRCGEFPFMTQNLGVSPDIITMAKGIASGFPMGACAARPEVAEAFEPGDHGSTFGGSCLAMAAANATLGELKVGGYAKRVEETGEYFADKLSAIEEVTEVRGSGLMIGADLAEGISAPAIVDAALEAGFVLNATGPSTLRFLPPLICAKNDIDALIAELPNLIAQGKN